MFQILNVVKGSLLDNAESITLVDLINKGIAFAILAVVMELDMTTAATLYLSCRIAYLVIYLIGINYLRTLIWLGSVIGLIMMLLALV